MEIIMSFSYLKKMPDPDTIKSEFALTPEMKALKADRDQQIADIITGKDDRVLAIIGPCSADKEEPVMDYIHRLARVNEQTKDKLRTGKDQRPCAHRSSYLYQ